MTDSKLSHIQISSIPFRHPVAILGRVWEQMRGTRADNTQAPPWCRFDPMDHPHILPWMLVLRPDPDGNLRYVVCGDACNKLFGIQYQGKRFGEGLPKDAANARRKEFDQAIETQTALFSQTNLPIKDREFIAVFRGVFPFISETGELQRIIVVIAPDEMVISSVK